jgi:ATP-binding cassette subfamily C protein/ATP-binding cassette subfamily C protein EexD
MSSAARKSPLSVAFRLCIPALTATFVLSCFINVTLLVSPIYSMQIYDRVLSSRNTTTLVLITAIVLAFLILYGILEYARSGILVRAGVTFETALRRPLFDSMLRAELDPSLRQGQQVIRDAETIRDALSGGTASTLFDLPWAPVFILLCFLMHPVLGGIAFTGGLLLFVLALFAEVLNKSHHERTLKLHNQAQDFAAAALRNGEAVRGLGMGDVVTERWVGHQSAAVSAHASAHERAAALMALSKFARVAVQTAALCAGAYLAIEREISPGAMMAASIIMGRALAPVEQIVGQWKRIIGARSAYRRLEKLFDGAPAQAEKMALPTPTGTLEVEKLLVAPLGSRRPSVRSVSFRLEAGESLAIVGASASGKSSLCRALAGVWPAQGGTIRVDGAALDQWDPNKLGKHVGYLPQDVELFAGTVAENIARLDKVDEHKVLAAAKAAGIHEMVLKLPVGYETPIGEGGVTLSGGMRQRVGLARALYGNPRIVLLDEPNSNLDEDGERALAKAIASLKAAGRTVVIVTHRPQILAHVDKLLVMSMGTCIAFGDRNEVIERMRGNRVAAVSKAPADEAAA